MDISCAHKFELVDYGAKMKCKNCESFYDVELAKKHGVPDMGLCKPTIIRDEE